MDQQQPTPDLNQSFNKVPDLNPAPVNPGRFNKVLLIILVAALILAGVAYAGIWYWQKQNSQIVIPTYTPRPDPTAGWKTYTNTQYGFEFKYPSDWTFTSVQKNNLTQYATAQWLLRSPETEQKFKNKTINPGYSYDLVVSYYTDGTVWGGEAGPDSPIYIDTITIGNNQTAKEYIKGGQGQNYAVVVEAKQPSMELWELSFETAYDKTKLTTEQNQILSTFKFTK